MNLNRNSSYKIFNNKDLKTFDGFGVTADEVRGFFVLKIIGILFSDSLKLVIDEAPIYKREAGNQAAGINYKAQDKKWVDFRGGIVTPFKDLIEDGERENVSKTPRDCLNTFPSSFFYSYSDGKD